MAMRKFCLPLFLLITVFAGIAFSQSGRRINNATAPPPPVQPPANPEPVRKPPEAPPTSLLFLPETLLERRIRSLDDNSFSLRDFSGKVLVINLWATWCGPCRKEIPEYEKVRKDFVGRNVEFVALTVDDKAAAPLVNKFVHDVGFGFILGWADKETARQLMGTKRAIPQTLVIDASGNIVNHWAGYSSKEGGSRLRDAIDNALR
jgi:thiol-disulfide isomerase/thioredoxin